MNEKVSAYPTQDELSKSKGRNTFPLFFYAEQSFLRSLKFRPDESKLGDIGVVESFTHESDLLWLVPSTGALLASKNV